MKLIPCEFNGQTYDARLLIIDAVVPLKMQSQWSKMADWSSRYPQTGMISIHGWL